MSVTQVYPGQYNVYIPNLGPEDTKAALIIDFSRNPKDFMVNKYAQIVPTKREQGKYVKMTVEEAGRITDSSGANRIWKDGADRPSNTDGLESFGFYGYFTLRYNYGVPVGYETEKAAPWSVVDKAVRDYSQQAMTFRTMQVVAAATTTANYDSNHYGAVTGLGSVVQGKWDVSTTARLDIKKSINYAQNQIRLDTLGKVKPGEQMLVINPNLAAAMANSQEIADFVKGSVDAIRYLKEELGPNAQYGLPASYAGVQIVVEDAVKVTSRKGATRVASYVLSDTSAFICSRPGGLIGVDGAPSFSTLTQFMHEEMTLETFDDPRHRRTDVNIVENFDTKLTAPVSGFLFTSVSG